LNKYNIINKMSEGIINSCGLCIQYSNFIVNCKGKKNTQTILNSLTVREKPSHGKPKGTPLIVKHGYIHQQDSIIFPRIKSHLFLKYGIISTIKQEYINDPRTIIKYTMTSPLYDYQDQLVKHLLDNYYTTDNVKNNKSICYLQMDTGLGKTRIGCALANELGFPTLIVVPTIAIGYQWIDEANDLFPNLKTGFYHNKLDIDSSNHDLVVVVVNTFSKKDPTFIKGFGFMILDEAHEYYTKCNSNVLWLAQTRMVLGLSATPLERPDQLDKYVTFHLGQPVYALSIVDVRSLNFKGRVKCINYYGSNKYTESITTTNGTMSTVLTIGNIIQDPDRIKLIVKEVKRLYNEGHGIFVFAEHRNFLDILRDSLVGMSVEYADDGNGDGSEVTDVDDILLNDSLDSQDAQVNTKNTSIFKGGIHKREIQNAKDMSKKGSHIVLTTYGYSRRGISLTEMTALVLTTPRRNGLRQIIGRILRKGSDESIVREVIDIIDMNSTLHGQFYERKKVYTEKCYPLEYVRVECNDIESELPSAESELSTGNMTYDEMFQILNDIYD
jgi:superfamily II DNA or RNA helicase